MRTEISSASAAHSDAAGKCFATDANTGPSFAIAVSAPSSPPSASVVVVGSDVRLLELADLELQEIYFILDGRAAFEVGNLARDLAPLVVCGGVLGKPDAAEAVERRALEILFEYVLVRARAVYVDETAAEFLQLRDGDALVVDPRARAAFGGDGAADDGASEVGFDLGFFRAVAHYRAVGATAEHEFERPDQDGFSRARLAGDDIEPGSECDFDLLDDSKVRNCKLVQHLRKRQCPQKSFRHGKVERAMGIEPT